jgi:hypothetical protein
MAAPARAFIGQNQSYGNGLRHIGIYGDQNFFPSVCFSPKKQRQLVFWQASGGEAEDWIMAK